MMTIGIIIGAIFGLWFAFGPMEKTYQKGMERAPKSEAGYNLFSIIWGVFILFVFVVGSLTVAWIALDCMWSEPTTLAQRVTLTIERWGDIINSIGGMLK